MKEMMTLNTENKFLVERIYQIGSIAKNEEKSRHRVKHKPQGRSLWKCLNTLHEGGVPRREVRIQHQVKLQHRAHIEREYTDTYVPPQIEMITPKEVIIKEDPSNYIVGVRVDFQDIFTGGLQE
eukprot:Gb_19633 [translate_table: standard]